MRSTTRVLSPARRRAFPWVALVALIFTGVAEPADAAQVLRYSLVSSSVDVSFDPSTGGQLDLKFLGRIRLEGVIVLPYPVPLQLLPTQIVNEARWRYQRDNGFVTPQPSPVPKFCLGAPIFGFPNVPCLVNNETGFSGLPPDEEIQVQHTTASRVEPIGWSAIGFTGSGSFTIAPAGVGGVGLVGFDVVIDADDLVARPTEFILSKDVQTGSCPALTPVWDQNAKVCHACPPETPIYNSQSERCEACPQDRPFFDGEACTDEPPQPCGTNQRWDGDLQECVCHSSLFSWRPNSSRPLECIDRETFIARLPDNFRQGQIRQLRDTNQGWVFVEVCHSRNRHTTVQTIDPSTGQVRVELVLTQTEVCEVHEVPYWSHIAPKQTRVACNSGLGWVRCDEDPLPSIPLPYLAPLDLDATFGPCHFVGSVQVTSCGGSSSATATLPDLQVAQLSIENPVLAPGDPVELRVVVFNNGGQTAPNSELWIRWTPADGVERLQRLWIGSLAAGASRTLTAWSDDNIAQPFTAMAGTLSATAEADGTGVVLESNELNNRAATRRTIAGSAGGGPNLRAAWIVADPENPAVGSAVTWRYTIDNVGDQPAPASVAGLRIDRLAGVLVVDTVPVPALAPGASWQGQRTTVLAGSGTASMQVTVDLLDQVAESSELDNVQSREISVPEDTPCLPCTSGVPNHVGASLCFDGPGGVPETGSIWRCQGVRFDGSSCVASGNHPNGWAPLGDRCPPPETLCWNMIHADRCGSPGICPGTMICF